MIKKDLNESLGKSIVFFALYALIPLAVFLTALIGFWPGLVTADSGYQWEMAKGTAPMNAVHPVAHTVLIKLLLTIWDNPAVITLFGAISLSFSFAFCLFVLHRRGVNRFLLLGASLIFALSPNNLVLSITMWKDIPYTAALLAATGFILYLSTVRRTAEGNLPSSRIVMVSLYMTSIFLNLCWAFRYNGSMVTFGGLAVLLIFMWKEKLSKKILPVLLSGLVVGIFANNILPACVNSLPNTYDYTTKYMIRQVMGADLQSQALSEENSEKLWKIFDKEKVKENFVPEDFSPVLWNDEIWANYGENPDARGEVRKMYFQTLTKKPLVMIQNALQSSNMVWGIKKPSGVNQSDCVLYPPEEYNPIGIAEYNNAISGTISQYVNLSKKSSFFSVFWRNGLWLIISIALLFVLLQKKVFSSIFVFVPIALSTASCIIAVTAEYRYVWPLYAIIPILFVYFLYERSNTKQI
ncbi:DUF6020 family protein [Acetivibrio cellulolyticus]|uniref:DUF6020 family protein n=1 Tax=Acetivibrio cellulolyticus TaxID=35830 RepID=UPI0001E304C9|nr:DUF6020 family protein [Acetivibrio cellulolyticus]